MLTIAFTLNHNILGEFFMYTVKQANDYSYINCHKFSHMEAPRRDGR